MSNSQPLQIRSEREDTWLTPPHILKALGEFDLDPCTPDVMPWETAKRRYTKAQDGLMQPWEGRVWLNPPYGAQTQQWLRKMAHHGNGIALVFARTDTEMFFDSVWGKADAILFLQGRLHFHLPDGTRAKLNSGGASVLIAYGRTNAEILRSCGLEGHFVNLKPMPAIVTGLPNQCPHCQYRR